MRSGTRCRHHCEVGVIVVVPRTVAIFSSSRHPRRAVGSLSSHHPIPFVPLHPPSHHDCCVIPYTPSSSHHPRRSVMVGKPLGSSTVGGIEGAGSGAKRAIGLVDDRGRDVVGSGIERAIGLIDGVGWCGGGWRWRWTSPMAHQWLEGMKRWWDGNRWGCWCRAHALVPLWYRRRCCWPLPRWVVGAVGHVSLSSVVPLTTL